MAEVRMHCHLAVTAASISPKPMPNINGPFMVHSDA